MAKRFELGVVLAFLLSVSAWADIPIDERLLQYPQNEKEAIFKLAVNEEHKDRVFKFLFGNPENREWTLALYNAVNGSNYEDPDI